MITALEKDLQLCHSCMYFLAGIQSCILWIPAQKRRGNDIMEGVLIYKNLP
jgi:hypothetical protein